MVPSETTYPPSPSTYPIALYSPLSLWYSKDTKDTKDTGKGGYYDETYEGIHQPCSVPAVLGDGGGICRGLCLRLLGLAHRHPRLAPGSSHLFPFHPHVPVAAGAVPHPLHPGTHSPPPGHPGRSGSGVALSH